jgi:hypothetical protein
MDLEKEKYKRKNNMLEIKTKTELNREQRPIKWDLVKNKLEK